jgi:HSP20 family protein
MIYPTLWRSNSSSMWDDAFSVRRDFDRLLNRFAGGQGETLSAWAPSVDVEESRDEIVVTAELPGVQPDDVNVTVENGILAINGEKREERQETGADANTYVIERRYGRFERSFTLPSSVSADQVKAEFDNGVLRIRLPKTEQAKPRRIEVQPGSSAQAQRVNTGRGRQAQVGSADQQPARSSR